MSYEICRAIGGEDFEETKGVRTCEKAKRDECMRAVRVAWRAGEKEKLKLQGENGGGRLLCLKVEAICDV